MNLKEASLIKYLPSIRHPISLAATALAVFYGVYRLLLALDVFSRLDSDGTRVVVLRIVDWVFWLVLATVVLAIGAYAFVRWNRRRASNVDLIGADQVPNDPYYVQEKVGDKKVIRRRKEPHA